MLAVAAMSGTVQFIFWLVAVLVFLVAAFLPYRGPAEGRSINLVALGLAIASFVFMWAALAAS